MFQVPKIISKADWLGAVIVFFSFEKPKSEIYIFNRTTLPSFAMMVFITKNDLI